MPDAFENMDRMYRFQRHIYDATRKYYLLGRDTLLNELHIRSNECVLEIGCGTGRNLVILANRFEEGQFFGLDASAAMLEIAQAKLEKPNVKLQRALADDFSYAATFGMETPFDKIFFSYSISMIPNWREAVNNALANLKPGGELYIVDFYDQKDLPRVFQRFLKWWLAKFHVRYWDELIPYLESLRKGGDGKLTIMPLFRRYSFIAKLERSIVNIRNN